jgi:FAD/FMN-containing dehydrogenase/Fe-S oxidoreductase
MPKLVAISPSSHDKPINAFQDANALAQELERHVKGEVRFDKGSRGLYATDGSNYRQIPIGVVIPKDDDDCITAMRICRGFGAPVLSRGGGTSLAGQCCNVAVVLDFSKYMNQLLELNYEQKYAQVQPGIVLDSLRKAAEMRHLTFAPDPATHTHCTLGGMIGNNSCGVHSIMGGKTVDNVHELEILTYDGLRLRVGETSETELDSIIQAGGRRGEIYAGLRRIREKYADLIRKRYPKIPRRVSGFNLDSLLPENKFNVAQALVGSEGTCVMVLEAKVRLVHSPPARTLVVLGYSDVYVAADHVPEIMRTGPIGLEGIDEKLVSSMKKKGLHASDLNLLPDGKGWLLAEFGGESKEEADARGNKLMKVLKAKPNAPTMKLYDDKEQEKKVWEIRESGLGATAFVPGEPVTWEGWEDSAVPPERLGDYLRDLRRLMEKHGYNCSLYGHFGHGCVHTRIDFDFRTRNGIRNYRAFIEDAADLVVSYGGSLSGEHGDGQSRAEFLPRMFGEELVQAFREFKSLWDPEWKMNPGKVVEPYKIDENLRLGVDYKPWRPETHFKFPEDEAIFANATMRCVGVGKCRRHEGGVMCPSYMVTLEEKHSTRGRAHMLFEMLQGEVVDEGWKDEDVKEALDLCFSCKGCKGECPVNVDVATYKAEFMSHYYEFKARPLNAYAFGWINKWANLAAFAPDFANFLSQTPGISDVVKSLLSIPEQRQLPEFAPYTFREWFLKRPVSIDPRPEVILWADTFNNHFHPETARAAVEVLEAIGWRVQVPKQKLCCGRPLYDFGMLHEAKRYLKRIIEALRPQIERGMYFIVLEPSCASVFRDELKNLLPDDLLGQRLAKQIVLLSEFIESKASTFDFPRLKRKALVHGHCHHQALLKMEAEKSVLRKVGLEADFPDSGCCGMAGPFGFEANKYEVSQQVGERVLLPAVRAADEETLIISNGFSCREQIRQSTNRHALHLADVLRMALRNELPRRGKPEEPMIKKIRWEKRKSQVETAAALSLTGIAAAAAFWMFRKARENSGH